MRMIAGVGWTDRGFEISIAGSERTLELAGADADTLLGRLAALDESGGVTCVFDTSNALAAERALATGLPVARLDPQHIPVEWRGGRVPAAVLAEIARKHSEALIHIGTDGFLADRVRELDHSPLPDHLRELPVRTVPGAADQVYLTFDDGPSEFTIPILRTLEAHGAKATFFEVGLHVVAHPATVAAVAAEGHAIGNHSWSHPYTHDASTSGWRKQLDMTSQVISEVTGERSDLFRPPYGRTPTTVVTSARDAGLRTILWSLDPKDWARPGAETIAADVLSGIAPGAIVLLHSGGGDRSQTVEALPAILRGLSALGLTAARLP